MPRHVAKHFDAHCFHMGITINNFWHPGTVTLGAEHQSARMSKITDNGLTRSGIGCFIDVPIWKQWASKGWLLQRSIGHVRPCWQAGWMAVRKLNRCAGAESGRTTTFDQFETIELPDSACPLRGSVTNVCRLCVGLKRRRNARLTTDAADRWRLYYRSNVFFIAFRWSVVLYY